MIPKLCFIVVAFVTMMLIIAWAGEKDVERNEYHECVMKQMEGTSIPLQDAWVIFNDVCQQK